MKRVFWLCAFIFTLLAQAPGQWLEFVQQSGFLFFLVVKRVEGVARKLFFYNKYKVCFQIMSCLRICLKQFKGDVKSALKWMLLVYSKWFMLMLWIKIWFKETRVFHWFPKSKTIYLPLGRAILCTLTSL
jgi:hypothetical protein